MAGDLSRRWSAVLWHQSFIKSRLIDRNSYVIIYASEHEVNPINELLMTIPMQTIQAGYALA